MTIKLAQLRYAEPPDDTYIGKDVTDNNVYENDVLALVRQIMRDRSDCDQIPVVMGVRFMAEPDQWGSNLVIDVQYSKRGYRALYGATLDTRVHNLQCYMD